MSKIHIFEVGPQPTSCLAGRTNARDDRRGLEHHTASTQEGHDIFLDFSRVAAMTYPYADELLGEYYADAVPRTPTTTVIALHGLNDDTRETIALCLRLRRLLAVEIHRDVPRLLGAPDVLRSTYTEATALGTFRAHNLAERIHASTTNANNRLQRLVEGRTLRRQPHVVMPGGGKEYLYAAPDVRWAQEVPENRRSHTYQPVTYGAATLRWSLNCRCASFCRCCCTCETKPDFTEQPPQDDAGVPMKPAAPDTLDTA